MGSDSEFEFVAEYLMHGFISRGSRVSPIILVMLMTVVMHDACGKISPDDHDFMQRGGLAGLLYSDGTLRSSNDVKTLARYLAAVSEVGRAFGLELNLGKVQLFGHQMVRSYQERMH